MMTAIVVLSLLVLINGIFAMSELAVMTSRHARLERLEARGSRGAAVALSLSREPTRFLSTVQVGITLVGVLAGAVGEQALSGRLEPIVASVSPLAPWADAISLWIVVLLITYFTLVVGELVPKRIALAHPEAVATAISRPLNALSVIAAWPIRVLSWSTEGILALLRVKARSTDDVSEDDVRALIVRAASTGVFTPQEHRLFQRIMRAGDLRVRDLMVPRRNIIWIDESEPIDSVRVLVGTSPHSHFPVCRGDLDHCVGVVHVKDLIAYGLIAGREFKVTTVAHTPLFVPETMPALRLLDQFQSTKVHIAFVVDEHGGLQGMLTLNDVTQSIVGDVSRKGEAGLPTMHRRDDGSWLVDGRLPVVDLVAGLGLPAPVEHSLPDVSTVGGLIHAVLDRIAQEGETLSWQGWTIEVVDMDGATIDKAIFTKQ
ncbi:MAG: HlyC/CorC family transporter [Phycisphaerae bacterium]|nr:HlyC/CorC family transporter [Phycisphaerae bacterium]